MPDALRSAHLKNDAAVRAAYGFCEDITENDLIVCLLQRYKNLLNTKLT